METTVFDVAKYILYKIGESITWRLHKLCFYAQAWHLVWEDKPLFYEYFEAWGSGPVCVPLYRAQPKDALVLSEKNISGDINNLSTEQKECIDIVLRDYGHMEPYELWAEACLEEPWIDAHENDKIIITRESMKKYYSKRYNEMYDSEDNNLE